MWGRIFLPVRGTWDHPVVIKVRIAQSEISKLCFVCYCLHFRHCVFHHGFVSLFSSCKFGCYVSIFWLIFEDLCLLVLFVIGLLSHWHVPITCMLISTCMMKNISPDTYNYNIFWYMNNFPFSNIYNSPGIGNIFYLSYFFCLI